MTYCNISIQINQFAQNSKTFEDIVLFFEQLNTIEKNRFYCILFELIQQSKCTIADIDEAIQNAEIKPTLNCCIIARKGVNYSNIKRTEKLKDVFPTLKFLLSLFKIGYIRRRQEVSASQKWWYRNLEID